MALHAAADRRTSAAVVAAGAALSALAAVLAGCMERPAPVAAGPTLEPGYGLYFSLDGDRAKLAYGQANSDDIALMLECERGSRTVEITDVAPAKSRESQPMLILASGKMISPLPARTQANEEGEGVLAMAQAPTSLPALDGFRRTGSISVRYAGRQHGLSATARERAQVARFFTVCERK